MTRVIRRLLDLLIVVPAMVVLAPLTVALLVVATFDTRAPGLFRQRRVGRGGREFWVYKIRSMRVVPGLQTTITTSSDTRITTFGAWLRRWKLDELPQAWNVVTGRMGLVGPRPDVPGYADQLTGPDRAVADLRPGITGPASLVFREEEALLAAVADPVAYNDEVVWPAKVAINLAYAEHATLVDDARMAVFTLLPSPRRLAAMLARWDPALLQIDVVAQSLGDIVPASRSVDSEVGP